MLELTLAREGQPMPTDEQELPKLNEQAIMAIQRGTVINSSVFAEQNFPEVSFPDETESETAQPEVEETPAEESEPTTEELAEVEAELAVN